MPLRSAFRFIIYSLLLIAFFFGCRKPEDVGETVLPAFDLLQTPFSDTATIQCVTLLEDSLIASGLSNVLLGSYVDPVFGLSQASIYAQIQLGNIPNLGDSSITADSMVLALTYNGSYGDTTTRQSVHVYQIDQLTDTLNSDSTYYTNQTFNTLSTDLVNGSFSFTPYPTDSVSVDTTTEQAQLRIPLNITLANNFLSLLQQAQYQSNTAWLNNFQGIYIKTDPVKSGGAILYFDPLNANSKLSVYYHTITNTAYSYDFAINGARINHFEHNYGSQRKFQIHSTRSGTIGKSLADSANLSNSDTMDYLQSMAGLRMKLNFPYLQNFIDSGSIVINKALLVFTVPPTPTDDTSKFPAPANLLLTAFDTSGAITFIPDYYEANFGGYYNQPTNTYTFSVAREIQQILDGTIADFGLSLNVSSSAVQANRVLIGSGKSIGSRMKLRLFYTRVPQSAKHKPANKQFVGSPELKPLINLKTPTIIKPQPSNQ